MVHSQLSNQLQELAAGYVLDDLDATEKIKVEQLMQDNPSFLREIQELQAVMGSMATNVPLIQPPDHLFNQVMNAWET